MTIYFLTKQKEVCSRIAESLTEAGHASVIFTEPDTFFASVKMKKGSKIDLLAIDYRMFDHDIFNPYHMLNTNECTIPLIYYNDPIPEPEERAVYWKVKNHSRLGMKFTEAKSDALFPLLQLIQNITNDSNVNPYISIINKPKEYHEEQNDSLFDIEAFKREIHLPDSRLKLLHYLYENRNRSLSIENICSFLWNSCTAQKVHTLYSYIHELRAAFRNYKKQEVRISREGNHSYMLSVYLHQNGELKNVPVATASDYLNNIDKSSVHFKSIEKTARNTYKTFLLV